MSYARVHLRWGVPGLVLGIAIGCSSRAPRSEPSADPGALAAASHATSPAEGRGAELFERHCALCHGQRGAGDGPAAALLFPPARDLTRARFRLVGTTNAVPSRADLVATLRRGIPGSAMPSWDWLPDEDLDRLAEHVRVLAIDGLAERLASADPELATGEAIALATERLTPGPALESFRAPTGSADELARGRVLFEAACAPCHGLDGRGGRETPRWNEDGSLNWARDFTAGVMKGGAGDDAIARRILCGMPGTAMPPIELEPDELAAVVAWVQSLIPPGSADELVQRRRRLVGARVSGRVPWTPDDPRWQEAPRSGLVLAPLAWSDDSIVAADVRAVHDGAQVAVRVAWSDATADGQDGGPTPFPDACALLFSADEEPPIFGMGTSEHPTVLWHWRSSGPERTVETLPPHGFVGPSRGSLAYVGARPWAEGESRAFEASGFDHLEPADGSSPGGPLRVRARRVDWGWEVVFVRPMGPGAPGGFAVEPGRSIAFGLALWNGSGGDHRGRKSVTIWHELALER